MTNKSGHEFWVIMLKRRDYRVYADLHKTNQKIYLTYEDALGDFNCDGHFKEYYHIVKMIATLDEEEWPTTLEINHRMNHENQFYPNSQ